MYENIINEGKIRERRKWEDTLLNTRSGIFLILNGLAVQADLDLWIAITISIINSLWIIASIQSLKLIADFTKRTQNEGQQYLVTEILGDSKLHHSLRPTSIVGKWIPMIVYISWIIYIAFSLNNHISYLVLIICPTPFLIVWLLSVLNKKTPHEH